MAKGASTDDILTPGNQPNGVDSPAETRAATPSGEAPAGFQPEPEAEAAEPPAAAVELNTNGVEGPASPLTTPSGTMAPGKLVERLPASLRSFCTNYSAFTDTPPSDPSTHIQEGAASPTSHRQQVPLPSHTSNGALNNVDQINHTIQQSNNSGHETGRFPAHQAASSHGRPRQPHLSNGSFTSATPYPAPHSGGSLPQLNGLPARYALQAGVLARPAVDGYGRPLPVAPQDAFSPSPGLYHHQQRVQQGYPPHSHHGSQSSVQADEQNYGPSSHGNRYSTYSTRSVYLPLQQFHPQIDPAFNGPDSSNAVSGISGADAQTLFFLQNSFGDREFSDCTLELRFVQQETSHDFPCHRVVISRSPRLRHLLRTTAANPLLIELDDPFMQTDAFIFTLRTLYGWDIDREPYLPSHRPPQDANEALDSSLAFAAAARYLDLPLVHATAIRHACQHLTWETIDRACHFALPRAIHLRAPFLDNAFSRPEDYSVWELLDAITTFLVYNLSLDFFLDVNAGDYGFSRLPATYLVSRSREETVTRHSHRPTKSHHLSIQFGDLKPTIADTVLSRILLNLPFPMLKHVLEHPHLAKPSGELSLTQRRSLIEAVVGEREARRVRAVENPQLHGLAQKLEGASKPLSVHSIEDFHLNSMGFKEEVFDGDTPYILQSWIHSSDSVST